MGASCSLEIQGKETLPNGKLCTSHTSGLAGARKAGEHWEVSEEAVGKGKEEQGSDQDQQVLGVQVSVNGYHSPCICVGMLIFAGERLTNCSCARLKYMFCFLGSEQYYALLCSSLG